MYIFPGEGYLYSALSKLIDFPISPTIIKHLSKSVLKYYHALLRTLLEDVARDYLSIGVYYLSRIYGSPVVSHRTTRQRERERAISTFSTPLLHDE